MTKTIQAVPQHVLFKLCREAVPKASLAHTLTECLYWSQHAIKEIDGKPAIWKTGAELAKVLGIAPKTANEHLKRLASLGFWELKYRPRPYHPSPVTWLLFNTKAFAIVEAGRTTLVSKATSKGSAKCTVAGTAKGALSPTKTDAQSCQYGVLKQHIPAALQNLSSQEDFIPEKSEALSEKNELPQKQQKAAGKEKAPSYIEAAPGVEALVNAIQEQLAQRDMPEWDTSSQYTWKHARALWGKLNKAGISELPEQVQFVSCVLENWPKMQDLMAWRYRTYAGNYMRPTPLALAHEFEIFKDAIFPPPAKGLENTGGGFDFEFS